MNVANAKIMGKLKGCYENDERQYDFPQSTDGDGARFRGADEEHDEARQRAWQEKMDQAREGSMGNE